MTTYQFYRELGDQNMVEITIKWKNCVKREMMCFYNIYYCCVCVGFFYCNRCANINKFWHDPSTIPASQWFVIGTLTAYNFIANIIILWLELFDAFGTCTQVFLFNICSKYAYIQCTLHTRAQPKSESCRLHRTL